MGDSKQELLEISQEINNQINNIYPLTHLYSNVVTKGDIISLIIFVAISLFTFMVFSFVVGKVFKRIKSTLMTGRYNKNNGIRRTKSLKSSTPLIALYKKDFKRYFASAVYVMNTGFGVVIMVLGAIALPFIDVNALIGELNYNGAIKNIIPVFIVFCIATSCTTMASISIEGKQIWIAKNLPVSVLMIFASKILVNLTVLAPTLLASLLICYTMQLSFIDSLLIVLLAASFSIFVSLYGLVINLSFPNLSWTNETVIVKQSMASMISVFTGIGMAIIQYFLIMVIGKIVTGLLVFIGILFILSLLLCKRLASTGKRQFEKLL